MTNPKPKARSKVRVYKGSLELSAYAGINPATGKKSRVYDHLPVSTEEKEIQRALSALVAKGDSYLDSDLLPELGEVATWRLRPALDAAEAERDPDL